MLAVVFHYRSVYLSRSRHSAASRGALLRIRNASDERRSVAHAADRKPNPPNEHRQGRLFMKTPTRSALTLFSHKFDRQHITVRPTFYPISEYDSRRAKIHPQLAILRGAKLSVLLNPVAPLTRLTRAIKMISAQMSRTIGWVVAFARLRCRNWCQSCFSFSSMQAQMILLCERFSPSLGCPVRTKSRPDSRYSRVSGNRPQSGSLWLWWLELILSAAAMILANNDG